MKERKKKRSTQPNTIQKRTDSKKDQQTDRQTDIWHTWTLKYLDQSSSYFSTCMPLYKSCTFLILYNYLLKVQQQQIVCFFRSEDEEATNQVHKKI